ncbi:hypothetical protein HN832_04095 [archaeon]|jgi:hypothetical protein|nr:hypothetical protein [archaeon]MBT4373424.1 hypothetical protein [archaeon]MBT4531872.1 hypothetical protein [archaeon]MBT7001539.1 hypothetical protein [archaeon]MBT7282569.1 hypothetical protein [archaeon]
MTIPSRKLIGQNVILDDEIYSDDYMRILNRESPVEDVFGKHKSAIAQGKNVVARLVMDTLGNSKYEQHLVNLIMRAAKVGEWRAREVKGRKDYGLDAVLEKKFGYLTEHKGKTYLLPSFLWTVHCHTELDR